MRPLSRRACRQRPRARRGSGRGASDRTPRWRRAAPSTATRAGPRREPPPEPARCQECAAARGRGARHIRTRSAPATGPARAWPARPRSRRRIAGRRRRWRPRRNRTGAGRGRPLPGRSRSPPGPFSAARRRCTASGPAAPARLRAQEDVRPGEPRLPPERVGVLGEVALELLLARLRLAPEVGGQELELLPEPAADDRVVAVQPERQRLAVVDLLADVVIDQPVELLGGRRAEPNPRPVLGEGLDRRRADDDLLAGRGRSIALRRPHQEQPGAGGEEEHHRLAEDRARHACDHGVYQIGEVYARSSWTIGTLAGRLSPKYLASYAVQRGVGISITRA